MNAGRSPIYNSFAYSPRRTSRMISTERAKVLENLRRIQSKDNDNDAKFTSFIVYMLGGEHWSQNPQESMERFMESLNSIHRPEASASSESMGVESQTQRHFWGIIGVNFSVESFEELCSLPSMLFSKLNEKSGNKKEKARRTDLPKWKRPKLSSRFSIKNESWSKVYTILGYIMTHALACDTSFTADVLVLNHNSNENEDGENPDSNVYVLGWEEFTLLIQNTVNQSGFISKKMHCSEHYMFEVGRIMYVLDCMELSTDVREQVNEGLMIEKSEGTGRGLKTLHCLSPQEGIEIDINVGSVINHLKMDW